MKSAISNIAWPSAEDDAAIALAASLGFAGIEIAPMRIFGPLESIDLVAARAYHGKLRDSGLTVPALQGLLFGVPDVHLFMDEHRRSRLHHALLRIADVAVALQANACVFGAPAVRDPGDLPPRKAWDLAVAFFRNLGPCFAARGVAICFEANPPLYRCRFVTRTLEAFNFVKEIASPGIRLQLDTGTVFINDEPPELVVEVMDAVVHCHVSEPNLDPVGSGNYDHQPIASSLKASGYDGWLSIEMRETATWQDNIRLAARLMRDTYA